MVADLGYDVHLAGRAAPQWPDDGSAPGAASVTAVAATGPPLYRGLTLSRALGRVCRRLEPDLVHAHWLPEFGWIAARERLAPLVCSAWGSDVLNASRLASRRSRAALEAATTVLADSAPLARAAEELARTPLRVEIVHAGIALDRYRPAEDRGESRRRLGWPDAPTVLSPRSLAPLYNVEVVVDAFALVRERLPDARLVIKHPSTEIPHTVVDHIRERGLAGAVTVVGHVEESVLPEIYRAADVVVSIPGSDSSPRSVWEGLACGLPTIVSDLPWAREELTDRENAILTRISARAVADALLEVLTGPQLARRLGRGALALAEATVDVARVRAQVDAIYRTALSPAGA